MQKARNLNYIQIESDHAILNQYGEVWHNNFCPYNEANVLFSLATPQGDFMGESIIRVLLDPRYVPKHFPFGVVFQVFITDSTYSHERMAITKKEVCE